MVLYPAVVGVGCIMHVIQRLQINDRGLATCLTLYDEKKKINYWYQKTLTLPASDSQLHNMWTDTDEISG